MPSGVLPFVLIGAVAAIAAWVVIRFPALAPRTAAGVVGWIAASVSLTIASRPAFAFLGNLAGPVAALVIVEVGSGVCVMLAVAWTTLWVIRAAETSY
jgi:hypothetical protein